jgi:hypothetical protein
MTLRQLLRSGLFALGSLVALSTHAATPTDSYLRFHDATYRLTGGDRHGHGLRHESGRWPGHPAYTHEPGRWPGHPSSNYRPYPRAYYNFYYYSPRPDYYHGNRHHGRGLRQGLGNHHRDRH